MFSTLRIVSFVFCEVKDIKSVSTLRIVSFVFYEVKDIRVGRYLLYELGASLVPCCVACLLSKLPWVVTVSD